MTTTPADRPTMTPPNPHARRDVSGLIAVHANVPTTLLLTDAEAMDLIAQLQFALIYPDQDARDA